MRGSVRGKPCGKSLPSGKASLLGAGCVVMIAALLVALLVMAFGRLRSHRYVEAMRPTDTSSPWNKDTPLIIVTSHFKEDLSWLKAARVPVHVCHKEGGAEFDRSVATGGVTVLPNRGHEAGAFLGFIIKFYDTLPQHVAFIHGHQTAWHQSHDLLEWIHRARIKQHAYIPLNHKWWRCTREDKDWADKHAPFMDTLWDAHFRPYLKIDRPRHLKSDCCAQFIVSRDRIRRLPRAAYEDWQRLFSADQFEVAAQFYKNKGHVTWGRDGQRALGTMFESLWHVIFGEAPELSKPDPSIYFG